MVIVSRAYFTTVHSPHSVLNSHNPAICGGMSGKMKAEDRYESRFDLFVAPDLINPVIMVSNFLSKMDLLMTYRNV
jgi:hypothetical protein